MNNERRKQIEDLKTRLEALKSEAEALIEKADELSTDIAGVKDDEQEYFDNMPENLQQGDRGQKAESAVNNLQEAEDNTITVHSNLQEIADDLQSAITNLEEAAE